MADLALHTLPKEERLCSRKALEELFGGGHQSVSAFPIRAVYMPNEVGVVRVMVSVSKRYFKRAVKRNRIKRQLREAYREGYAGAALFSFDARFVEDLLPALRIAR